MSEETVPALPYLHLFDNRDPIDVLSATAEQLAHLLDGLTPEQFERKPAPNKWNLREILAHLADVEIVWSWRFRQVLGTDNPDLEPLEQDNWAKSYSGYSVEQARAVWAALRAWNLAFLRTLSEEDRKRTATHAKMGSVTLWTLAAIAAGHDLHHLRSLEHVVAGFQKL